MSKDVDLIEMRPSFPVHKTEEERLWDEFNELTRSKVFFGLNDAELRLLARRIDEVIDADGIALGVVWLRAMIDGLKQRRHEQRKAEILVGLYKAREDAEPPRPSAEVIEFPSGPRLALAKGQRTPAGEITYQLWLYRQRVARGVLSDD